MSIFPGNSSENLKLPHEIDRYIAALAITYKHQKKDILLRALVNADISIDENSYDGLDGGQYGYFLHLELPSNIYSLLVDNKENYENIIKDNLTRIIHKKRQYIN